MSDKIYQEEPFTLKKYSGNAFKWENGDLLNTGLSQEGVNTNNHNYLWNKNEEWAWVDPLAFGDGEYEELLTLASSSKTITITYRGKT